MKLNLISFPRTISIDKCFSTTLQNWKLNKWNLTSNLTNVLEFTLYKLDKHWLTFFSLVKSKWKRKFCFSMWKNENHRRKKLGRTIVNQGYWVVFRISKAIKSDQTMFLDRSWKYMLNVMRPWQSEGGGERCRCRRERDCKS